jgi:hypothetical protein
MCGGMEFLMCKHTFDLNILQGLPKYSWHDVCEPDDLHDDLQRRQGTEASVFSTRRIQRELTSTGIYFYRGEIRAIGFGLFNS